MSSTTPRHTLRCLLLLSLCLAPGAASAQPELSGGSGLSMPLWDAVFASRYSPPLELVEHQSTATQEVTLDPARAVPAWMALGWLSPRGIGVEARLDYRRGSLGGVNGPYDVSLRYTSRPPPTSEPVDVSIDASTPWPDTTGHVWQATSSISVMGRVGRPDRANLRLLIGGGLTRVGGRFEPVGYSAYRLGGHSVLFGDERHVSVHMLPASAIGVSGGADLDVPLGAHASLVLGWRLFVPKTIDVELEADGVAASDEGLGDIEPATLQRTLAPQPVTMRPVTSDLLVGLRARF